MKQFTYDSNNSGGDWWLTDDDWKKLEGAGWTVNWESEPFLGALARSATKMCESRREAVHSFEAVTGQDVDERGCDCCGKPHSIY